ncbi:triose-phosphate isomerase [Hirschia baltica]|uniref:Triosephosphate isomerase n=1 Tax=Hirschia baltica (strain ATCC 49814 / DSM 5838 / IFAM 1418) TaxID=582402 RepID=C6XJT7_HIRBI|nr:triose-phosphate isomerase [Hirschia baltica]ACT59382.1 triosephosphate isomerase [Hirschia baltica ATCC 49814]
MSNAKPLFVGNWKMNGFRANLTEILNVEESIAKTPFHGDVVICPPATLAALAVDALKKSVIQIGGQDCHAEEAGAFTGDISAEKWKDLGAGYVIVGHSERRAYYQEDNKAVKAKSKAVLRAGLVPIICIGESLEERKAGKTLEIISAQIDGCIPDEAQSAPIAVGYEPVWAIGSGLTPTLEEISEAHKVIREALHKKIGDKADLTPIVYGGSLKPSNAKEILAILGVDGGLVGGASLKAVDFLEIIRACDQ